MGNVLVVEAWGKMKVFLYLLMLTPSILRADIVKLRIATPFKFEESKIDPSNVKTVQDATIARALYSGLLEYDKLGRIVLGAAEDFKVQGNEILFSLGKKVLLSNGEYLSAEDVEFTIKRNLIRNTSTHSNLRGFLCGAEIITSLDKGCKGIDVQKEKNSIRFILENENKMEMFISILTSHDLRIVPRKSVNTNLEIVNRKLVSGPYFLENISSNAEEMEMRANRNHFKMREKSAKSVVFKKIEYADLEKKFQNNEVDVIPLFHNLNMDLFKELSKSNNSFKTEGIKNLFLCFTPKGFKRFTDEERFAIGHRFVEKYLKFNKQSDLFVTGITIYPNLSEAYLNTEELFEIHKKIELQKKKFKSKRKMKIALIKSTFEKIKNEINLNDNVELMILDKPIYQYKDDAPDAYIETLDSTFTETANSMIYALRMGIYGYSSHDANEKIDKIYSEKSLEKKVEIIKKLHKEIIAEGRMISLGHAPYVAISKKSWSLDFSKYFAATNIEDITSDIK